MDDAIIGIEEAARLVGAGACRIFDCSFDLADPGRGATIYAAAHLPGARYLHLDDDLAAPPTGSNGRHPLPDPAVLAETLRAHGLGRNERVAAYDNAGGPYAARLWWLLRWMGHDAVAVLDGTVEDWRRAGHPVEHGTPVAAKRGDFAADGIRADATVDADRVLENIASRQALVVDARAAPRFRGEVLLMDAVAGHIPGARNRPFTENLADGRFKSAATLRDEFEATIRGFAPEDVILQCGSGVTACHNALAMHRAGLGGARLYPGSWSEWTSDAARPVELGEASATRTPG